MLSTRDLPRLALEVKYISLHLHDFLLTFLIIKSVLRF